MSVIKEVKAELRHFMKTCLEKVSAEETKQQSEAVCRKVTDSKWFQDSKRISIYVSTTGEIQTDSIIDTALKMGKEVFIPQFTKGSTAMEMVRLPDQKSFYSLPSTLWGIRQPDPSWTWESYHISGPLDLILAPGVAFTPDGLRCGHGKGYYDRFFSTHSSNFPLKSPLRIGLALRQQIIKNIPVSETDIQLDDVIYEGEKIVTDGFMEISK
ncbi:hypothetical protein GCK72_002317 [Caenorhabditis remanei]|uniref:5-formyltetrahydrofolate cyclo-ligase n=1 Tax=Caenorhabditis remanei TaxID=31234 RepID=A0A6A5HRE7_CAERE|nr:hypothetical protein GCK72_002317 [Caenorhabditis remanei]KAF1770498.1 hypothetical protein GCK72_002317 [Caenorhabditis remanei]